MGGDRVSRDTRMVPETGGVTYQRKRALWGDLALHSTVCHEQWVHVWRNFIA